MGATWRLIFFFELGVSKKLGGNTPKWMVKIMENPIKPDDLGGTLIFGNTQLLFKREGFYRRGSWLLTLSVF